MNCSNCGCLLSGTNTDKEPIILHDQPRDCIIALAAARGAVSRVIHNVALKLGEDWITNFVEIHGLKNLL